jgi:hypothetical protein
MATASPVEGGADHAQTAPGATTAKLLVGRERNT